MTVANCSMGNAQVRISTQSQQGVLWACVLVLVVCGGGCIPEPSSEMEVAACNENPEVIKLLIEKGADVNTKSKGGRTLLHCAAHNTNPEVIKLLIEKGADINAKDEKGKTPLHSAVSNTNPEVIKLLIEKGADVNAKITRGFYMGQTPLHFAACNENPEVIKLLIDKGADVNAKDKDGETPFAVAYKANNTGAIVILSETGVKLFDPDKLVADYKKSKETLAKNLAAISSYELEIAQLRDDLRKKENLQKSNPRSNRSNVPIGQH